VDHAVGSGECSDEPLGSGSTELVRYLSKGKELWAKMALEHSISTIPHDMSLEIVLHGMLICIFSRVIKFT
jgi:hypothetical protein